MTIRTFSAKFMPIYFSGLLFFPICLFLLTQYRNMHSMHIILMEITFVYDYIEILQWMFKKHVTLFQLTLTNYERFI